MAEERTNMTNSRTNNQTQQTITANGTERPNVSFGNEMLNNIPDHMLQKCYQNVNSINKAKDFMQMGENLNKMKKKKVGVFGHSETNLNWQQNSTRDLTCKCGKRVWHHMQTATSCSKNHTTETTKRGGAITCSTGRRTR